MAGPHETAIRELYEGDEEVSPHWFGVMIADARESDRISAVWAERAELEAEEMDDAEEMDE